ncbi:MAG: bifunctional glutamate N-acetyltransferase/amino-acid acetyltransferase ArgJ [Albidovulum sp.]|nr:bifunctional glutamate N-acetyltransferase/amino-acid acetyltransferase ArgJ [Albidovulum sp.]MDE0532139.1 bifunctional glutamate N-acetyltransferase/amino-acid acetyltransferase ArgJ [Albidovulum sp.]
MSPLAPVGGFPALPKIDGVEFSSANTGIRYEGRPDVMLAKIAEGSVWAGVFTKSATRSAPVLDCEIKLAALAAETVSNGAYAIIANSGNANAFTGARGDQSVEKISASTSIALGIPPQHVLSASTGVIGERLPDKKITSSLGELVSKLSPGGIETAARAIMTTDTYPKGAGAQARLDGIPFKIAGIAKGSGMIAPDMATMLCFIFTDAKISQPVLQSAVASINGNTFNSITVDGDTSTSDTVLVAATGRSAIPEITDLDSEAAKIFFSALGEVMKDLAIQIVKDGEGASKFVVVNVAGAESEHSARLAASSVANSLLVKTAIAGEDPNWGRVVMAVGKSGARADRDSLSIGFGDILVAENGWVAESYNEESAKIYMKNKEIQINIDLGMGNCRSTFWTCDITSEYVSINADYRS